MAPLVVFTDLDGTLLDARTYSAAPARAALARLAAEGIPVVPCSSKTAAEQRPLRRELGLEGTPFIVENGSAILVPEACGLPVADWPCASGGPERTRVLGRPFAEVRRGIARAAAAAGVEVTGYADLALARVAELTGLDLAAATLACTRDYSETLVDRFAADEWAVLAVRLVAEGLSGRHGGRFHTVTGSDADKGRAVEMVTALFAAAGRGVVRTVALGDSANDAGMLAAVAQPFLLAREDGSWAPIDVPGLRRISRAGPAGWHDAVMELLAARTDV